MSNSYTTVSTLIFALAAIAHLVRLVRGWAVQRILECVVGCLVVAALITIWGFTQLD